MSDESQSERIWRYAMHGGPVSDAPSTSVEAAPDAKLDDSPNVSTNLSNSFRPPASKLDFYGLAESQSQTLDALDASEILSRLVSKHQGHADPSSTGQSSSDLPGQRTPPSQSIPPSPKEKPPSKKPALAGLPTLESGHVTGASPPRGESPIIGGVVDVETKTAPPLDLGRKKENGHNKRLLQRNKASSFHVRPQEPSLSPPLKRLNTMPPRLNRYAPRDVQPSSQDSFAGSPPRQDLNTFIRSSKVLNNIYIRPGVAGKPSEVFELPSAESSAMPLPPPRKRKTATAVGKGKEKATEQTEEDEETPSQLIQEALKHGLIQRSPTPSAAPLPIVLAKDTQSDHRHSEDDANESKNVSGDDMEIQSDVQFESQAVDHSPAPSSSSFILPKALAMNGSESPQATQVLTQDIPSDVVVVSPHGITINSVAESGISSIPVPEHRRLEFLQRFRNRSEIVPATPISTVPPSGAGVSLMTVKPDNVTVDPIQATTHKENERTDMAPTRQYKDVDRPISKQGGPRRSERIQIAQSSKHDKHPQPIPLATEVVPDSQEENNTNSGTSQESAVKPKPSGTASDEVVPDSQEEELKLRMQQQQTLNPLSSPYIPLAQKYDVPSIPSTSSSPSIPLIQMTNRMIPSRFPTPTPAAVKSPLRKGLLPEGVTHTRGRGRPSVKAKEPVKPVVQEDVEVKDDESPSENSKEEENNVMEVDKETAPEAARGDEPVVANKRTRPAKSKAKATVKKIRAPKQKQRRKSPVRKVSSRKRKSDPEAEQQQPDEGPLPPQKRYRSSMTTPGPSVGLTELDKRVLAKRQDDDSYFYGGTAHFEFSYADPTPVSFVVEFDDGYEELIDLDDLRFFQLEPTDIVEVTGRTGRQNEYSRAIVLITDRWEDDEVAEVHDVESGPDGDDYEANGRDIRVSEEQIRLQWNERCINLRTLCRDKEFELPSRNKHLAGYAFIVTLPDLPKSKRSLQRVIELSGGVVCEWHSIVSLSGTSEADGNRVVGKSGDVRLIKNKTKLKNLFCIADEPRTTPKFLIALALGVPCLSVDWVLAKVADLEVKFDWQAHILPAGMNPVTKMAASQNFDRMWWRDTDNYAQLLSDPPVFKPFAKKSFLCLGSSFVLKSKEFGTYPRVLLAMGASAVQAVTDLKYLNTRSQANKFDYTVVDDDVELVSLNGSLGVNILWIKKCLITGIEGPVPWPE